VRHPVRNQRPALGVGALPRGVAAVREPDPGTRPAGVPSQVFNWTFVLLSCWLVGGAYLDAWHHHNLTAPETNPFTPYHFLLYSAEAAIAVFLGINILRNFRRFGTLQHLLPDSYGISLLGSVLFGISGVLDIWWHLRFGIEVSVAALFSPTHLLLMLSVGLIVSGPLRWALRDGGERATWPAVLSGALTLSIFTFWAQFDQPFMQRWASRTEELFTSPAYIEELGLLGLTLYAIMVSALLVLLLRRFTLPIGSITVILVINGALTSAVEQHPEMITVALAGGIAGDAMLYMLRPSPARPWAFHVFSFCVPAVLIAFYFAFLAATTGVWWPVSIWTGAVVVAGVAGWMISFVGLAGEGAVAKIAPTTRPT
jgi:hypothetical protein